MRRLLLVIVLALVCVPMVSFAQDQKIAWDLQDDNFIDVQDLGFRFYFPKGWVYDVKSGKGINVADTQDGLDALIDDDDSTNPDSLAIQIRGLPVSALTDLGENPTLDAMADFAVKAANVTETEPRIEVPIMSRRAITIIGTNSDGRAGIASLWVQNGFLVLVTLGTPDAETVISLAYTWGITLGRIKPLDAQELGKGMLTDDKSHFTINYPSDWTVDPNQAAVVYEIADEVGQSVSSVKGSVFTFSDAALSDLNLKDDATLDDVVAAVKAGFDLDESAISEEFVLLGQPAITLSGEPTADSGGAGHGLIVTATLVDGRAIILIVVTPSKETADAFMPTWVSMLSSVKSTETA